MFELAKSEFLRYQKWAWLWALLLLSVLTYLSTQRPLLAPNSALSALNNLCLIGGSFLFGLLQMALHKRKNHWTYLIHRPINSKLIYCGLFIAGISIVFVATVLPWLVSIISIDAFGASVVDGRHYSYPLFLMLTCIMAYQIGTLIVLNASWGSALLAVLIVVVLAPTPNNDFTQFFPVILFNVALFYLNLKSFKPDLSTHLKNPLSIILMSVPMSFSLALILLMSTMVYYHIPQLVLGNHADNNPEYGSLRYVNQYDSKDTLDYFLENNESQLATQIKAQAKLSEKHWFSASSDRLPVRGQLHLYDNRNLFDDKNSKTMWQFAHDEMLFIGHHKVTKAPAGVFGPQGFYAQIDDVPSGELFQEVPVILSNNQFMTSTGLYRLNIAEKTLQTRYTLPDGEKFVDTAYRDDYVSIRTNKRTVLFNSAQYMDEFTELEELLSFPNVGPEKNRRGVKAFELANGFVLVFASNDFFGFEQAGAQVYLATYDGNFKLVGERRFDVHSHPAWIRQYEYMVSPSLYYARALIFNYLCPDCDGVKDISDIALSEYNPLVNTAALVIQVLCLLAIVLLCRRHHLNTLQTLTWIILVALMSLPALLSFFFLTPFRGVYFAKFRTKSQLSAQTA